ncbi:hypothetical protein JCM8547_001172 [Rhodosporidiobolus lusitaniae]
MSNLSEMEQAFVDGTHPALARNAQGMESLRAASPTRSPSHSDDEEEGEKGGGAGGGFSAIDPNPPRGGTMPSRPAGGGRAAKGGSRNTGVKGVQADYREHMANQGQGAKGQPQPVGRKKMVISLDGDGAGKQEEDELEELRRKRLAELQGSSERPGGAGGARTFGHLREVGVEGFVQAVEDEGPNTAVVVHLYEPEIPPCHHLNTHLSTLARLYPSTKFLRAQASDLEFMSDHLGTDVDTLPTVLVYRGGEVETVWVRFDLELNGGKGGEQGEGEVEEGEEGRRAVEEVLRGANAISGTPLSLPSSALSSSNIVASANGTIRSAARHADHNDDDE